MSAVTLPVLLSDHSLIICQIPVVVDPAPSATRLVRPWRRVDHEKVGQALKDSALCQSVTTSDTDIDELFSAYDNVLRDIADRFAPVQTVLRRPDRRVPWFDDGCRKARNESRRRERRYHAVTVLSTDDSGLMPRAPAVPVVPE